MKYLRKFLPDFLKPVIRFIKYPQERRRVFQNIKIRKQQNEQIRNFDKTSEKLVVFVVPGQDWNSGREQISGGIISIISICEQSNRLKQIHGAEVLACTYSHVNLLSKHLNFDNQTPFFRFEQLVGYFKNPNHILIHLPEFMVEHFSGSLTRSERQWLSMRQVDFNILNQSIQLMPPVAKIHSLITSKSNVTITTAHSRYCTREFQQSYGVPLHKLSTWVTPENYYFKPYVEKENLIVVSPDLHPIKEDVLRKLSEIKGLSIQVIQNLTYDEYKKLISKAKWSITFGEGLDGYFVEPIFSGAVSFGLYNDDFFTPDFGEISTLYKSVDSLIASIATDIQELDNVTAFVPYQQQQFALCAKHYSEEEYKRNIVSFYKKEFTYA